MQEKVKIIDGNSLNKVSDASTLKLVDTLRKMNAYLNIHSECLVKTFQVVVDIMCKIKENEDLFKIIREKYLKTDTVHNQNLLDQNNFKTFSCQRDETYQQTTEESKLYHTQIVQMFKDLIENINKLNNKVDRLDSILQKKEITERATQSTVQTFANGLHSSKKIYIKNILKKDLEPEENVSTNNKKLNSENIVDKNKNNETPLHSSEVNNTIFEGITSETNQRPTTKRQVVVNNQNQETKKLDLKTVMKASRKTAITKYKEKVGNDYTKERFKNNTEIGIGCKHRAFLRFDGGMMKLSRDVFKKDTKLEKDTYYIEREGQKYLVFRNIDSANADVPNDSFTLMKLPEGCQKIDNNIVVDILDKARIGGIDGENSILIDSIEELQGLVIADEKIKNRYFNEAKNRRICSLLSNGDLMKTYIGEFEKGCKENEVNNYKDYMPLNDGQLEFRSEKEIDNDIYIKPYVKTVENLLINSSEKNKKTSTAELGEKLKMYNSLNRALIPETEINL